MRLIDQIHKLNYYVKVVEEGSIKRGSAKAYLSQPQMSKVIQQLEDVTNCKLLVRSKSGVKTTKEGEDLYIYAKKIINMTDNFELSLRSESKPPSGELVIGTYDSIARYFFPEFLKYFKQSHPDFKLHIVTGRSKKIINYLKSNDVDLGVVVDAKNFKGIQYEPIYKDTFGLYSCPGFNNDFTQRLIYFEFALNDTDNAIKTFKFTERICCDNLETVKSLVEEGVGVGLLPHKVARDGVLKGRLTPYHHPQIKKNSFDEHNIDICFKKKSINESSEYIKDVLIRFLEIWSRS